MRRGVEIIAFLGLSAAVHAGVVASLDTPRGGPQGQGAGGASRVTLAAAPDSLTTLADRWEQAPDAALSPDPLNSPDLQDATPQIRAETAVSRPDLPILPTIQNLDQGPAVNIAPLPVAPNPTLTTTLRAPPPPQVPGPTRAAPAGADADPARTTAPTLAPPIRIDTPEIDTSAPPPPGATDLATDRSPRPPIRPDRPRPVADPQPPAPASTAQPARTASGVGGGQTRGATATPTSPPAAPAISAAERQSLMSQWGGQIMARIERARPRVQGAGQVLLSLRVARSGQLAAVSIARSSGDPTLDQAAIAAVQRAGRFPAAPNGLTDPSYAFSLPIRFR